MTGIKIWIIELPVTVEVELPVPIELGTVVDIWLGGGLVIEEPEAVNTGSDSTVIESSADAAAAEPKF